MKDKLDATFRVLDLLNVLRSLAGTVEDMRDTMEDGPETVARIAGFLSALLAVGRAFGIDREDW